MIEHFLNQRLTNKFRKLLGEEWFLVLEGYFNSKHFQETIKLLSNERRNYTTYPEKDSELLFKAFRTVPPSKVKVIILGQDPYHDGSFDGFAFSNTGKDRLSPSLVNILKEVETDVYKGLQLNQDPNLQRWAEQGVLLINTAHTVRKGEAGSHLHLWKLFTKVIVRKLKEIKQPKVWMLWGRKAQLMAEVPNLELLHENNLVLTSAHPSPFSAYSGFFGNKHFSQANEYLLKNGYTLIKW